MTSLKNITTGDTIYCTGDSGFCDSSYEKVVAISYKYDEQTGEKYKVIHLSGDRQFDSRHGGAITPPLAYYILLTK